MAYTFPPERNSSSIQHICKRQHICTPEETPFQIYPGTSRKYKDCCGGPLHYRAFECDNTFALLRIDSQNDIYIYILFVDFFDPVDLGIY